MQRPSPTPLSDDYLRWEYGLFAVSEISWATTSMALVRGADALWERAEAHAGAWARAFPRDADGLPINDGKPMSAEDVGAFLDHAVDRVALLLLGLAIETTAKAIRVRQDPALVADASLDGLKTHNLVVLVKNAGFDVSVIEETHLGIVRDYVEWLGRYPLPLEPDKVRSVPGAWDRSRLPPARETWSALRPLLERIISKRDEFFRVPAV